MSFSNSLLSRVGAGLLFIASAAACGGSSDGGAGDGGGGAGGGSGAVNLGAAGNFVILAKSGVTSVPTSAITGDIGVSPIGYAAVVGFDLTPTAPNAATVYATSPQVTGQIFGSDYISPTPSNLTTAVGAMELAFTDAAGRPAGVTELGAGNIGGMTLTAGVYKWGTGLLIPADMYFSGSSTDVWILQIAGDLNMSSGVRVHLLGGALAKNITWQVGGTVTLGSTAHLEGVVLCQTAITLGTGATVNGRLLSQTAVTLDGNTVVQPAP
jgi:hypothetical protein